MSDVVPGPAPEPHVRTLRGDVAVYGVSSVAGQAIAVIAVPLYARWLGPSEYGLVELLTVLSSLLITACGDGVASACQKIWFDESAGDRRRAVVPTGVLLGTGATVVASVVAYAVATALGAGSQAALAVALLSATSAVAARVSAERFRAARRPWPYVAAMVTRSLVGAVAALVLVTAGAPTARNLFLGFAIGSLLSLGVTAILGPARGAGVWHPTLARRLAAIAIPLVPAGLAGWSMMLADRLVLSRYEPLAAVGIYGLANRVASTLLLVVYAFGTAWTPFALGRIAAGGDGESRERARALRYLTAAVTLAGVALAVAAPWAIDVAVGARYAAAADQVPTLALAFVLLASVTITQVPLLSKERTKEIAVLAAGAAVLNLIACLVLVPPFGITGAAAATVVGFGAQAVLFLWRSERTAPAPGAVVATVTGWVVAAVALGAVGVLQQAGHGRWSILVLVGLLPVAWLSGLLRPGEVRALIAGPTSGEGQPPPIST